MEVGDAPDGYDGGRGAFVMDWTQGSILGNLLKLSWPMVVSSTLMMIGPTIDMIWVGKLGSASVAGVGVAGIAVQLTMGAMMGLAMGMRALIARSIGAGDVDSANHVAQQGFVVSCGFAILMAIIGIFLSERILGIFELEPEVVVEGSNYLRIQFVGMAAVTFRITVEGVMQASGDAVTPMVTATIYRLFHITLSPFLIFGLWIFPELGVSGAAVTNVISQSLGVALGMWYLLNGKSLTFIGRSGQDEIGRPAGSRYFWWIPRNRLSRMRLSFRNYRFNFATIRRIIRIGAPAMVSGMQRTLGQFILMKFVSPFGTYAVAAHSVVQRIEMVLFIPGMAFGQAAGVLAGQNLGAQKPERAERSAWMSLMLSEVFLIACSLVLLVWPSQVVSIFNSEPGLLAIAVTYVRIAITGYVLMGFTSTLMSVLSGAGDTIPPMIFSLITAWGVQLPLAFFLPKVGDLGVFGVRWAISSGFILGSVLFLVYFRTGRWKRKRV
jgi:Na+-driven multidrug efflux pump